MKNTVAIDGAAGQQADGVPAQSCAFPGVFAARTSGVRADLPRSLQVSEKEDTCSISPPLLLSVQ